MPGLFWAPVAGAVIATAGQATSVGPNQLGGSGLAAPADHVHDLGKALQRARAPVPATVGPIITWTFDTPFVDAQGAPLIPSIGHTIECPDTSVVFDPLQLLTVTSTGLTALVRCTKAAIALTGLLTLTLGGAAVPGSTFLHLSARNPSV